MVENQEDSIRQSESKEQQENVPYLSVYFFSGNGSQNRGLSGVHNLTEMSQIADLKLVNSATMNPVDKPIPHRFETLGKNLDDSLNEQKKQEEQSEVEQRMVIVATSLGASEMAASLAYLQQTDPELLKERINKLDVVLLGPTGLKGVEGLPALIKRTVTLMRSQPGAPLTKPMPTEVGGIESLFTVPMHDEDTNEQAAELNKKLQGVFPNRDNMKKVEGEIIGMQIDQSIRKNLSEEVKTALSQLDADILHFIDDWTKTDDEMKKAGNTSRKALYNLKREVTRLKLSEKLKQRVKLLHDPINNGYGGEYRQTPATLEEQAAMTNIQGIENMAVGYSAFADQKVLLKAALSGEAMKQMQKLLKMGMKPSQIRFMVQQWDIFFTAKDLIEAYPEFIVGDEKPEIVVTEGATHAGWLAQETPHQLMTALDRWYPKKKRFTKPDSQTT